MKYYVYILENAKQRHYVGITTEPARRLEEHNAGSTKSTRAFGLWKIIYTEEFEDRRSACKREWYLKHAEGHMDKLSLIEKFGEVA